MYLMFDGGNGGVEKSAGYGSFVVRKSKNEPIMHHITVEFEGASTSNEAEYKTLLYALEWLRDHYFSNIVLDIEGDSELIRKQVLGEWQIRRQGEHLRVYRDKIQHLLRSYQLTYKHVPRAQIVAVLGH